VELKNFLCSLLPPLPLKEFLGSSLGTKEKRKIFSFFPKIFLGSISLVTITDVVFTAIWALPRVDETHGGCHVALWLTWPTWFAFSSCFVWPGMGLWNLETQLPSNSGMLQQTQ